MSEPQYYIKFSIKKKKKRKKIKIYINFDNIISETTISNKIDRIKDLIYSISTYKKSYLSGLKSSLISLIFSCGIVNPESCSILRMLCYNDKEHKISKKIKLVKLTQY